MRQPPGTTLAVACLVVLAGCSLPSGDAPSPTATPTPTRADVDRYPPGVSADGIENGTALYRAHVDAITATGYEAVATVNTTILREGFLVSVRSEAQIRVEPNASRYHEQRLIVGGLTERREAFWSNGSVEFRRLVEGGDPEYERREPRGPRRIAGRRLLLPFLAGGAFSVESTNETAGAGAVILVATSMADPEAVRPALPSEAESIGSFRSRVVVEGERIRSLVADVEYVIEGRNRTHHVEYELVDTGDVAVERPDWIEDVARGTETETETETETATEAATANRRGPRAGPVDRRAERVAVGPTPEPG